MFFYGVSKRLKDELMPFQKSLKDFYLNAYNVMKVFGYTLSMETFVKENPLGGNPNITVEIVSKHDCCECQVSSKVFTWCMTVQTKEAFINEIKAYIFDSIVDKIEM